ncbi:tRNA (adenosine(37)-N6)-threonylcarbamoyltransferase complex ATPase subunit type 1 TsaE [Microcystis elabens FACHB-917]|nr:tRNA (adenosine(37)-N6)-threonylcarbamoyltransferase complex ATPase subunit type 1 TsaE [Microcystis elabens FACHB-917]
MESDDAIEVCHLADPAATDALGRRLAGQLIAAGGGDGALLLLRGELGAGKTSLVQGLAAALGISEPVTSPTFALAQHYDTDSGSDAGTTALVHLDLYRLEPGAAADELFAQEEEDARGLGAVLAVEWPERLSFRPEGAWEVVLSHREDGEGRLALITPPGFTPPEVTPPRSSPAAPR